METTIVAIPAKSSSFWVKKRLTGLVLLFILYKITPTILWFCTLRCSKDELHDLFDKAQGFLVVSALILIIYGFRQEKHWRKKLGIWRRKRKRKKSLAIRRKADTSIRITAIWTFGLSVLMVIAYHFFGEYFFTEDPQPWYFYFFYALSCLIQEYLFCGIIYAEFKTRRIDDKWFILFSAINFAYLHVFYLSWTIVVLAFLMRILWSILFSKYHNLWACAGSHLIVGGIALFLGLIP